MTRRLLHRYVLRPLMRWLTGAVVHHSERLPAAGPAIVFANHNSHIDTALLMAAFPTELIDSVRPLAAADYWFANRVASWFSRHVVGAIAVDRSGDAADPLAAADAALSAGDIVILFPEGTRGEPGRLGRFHSGVVRLAAAHPEAVVIPVWLAGCDRVLPPHRRLPRRVRCSVTIGAAVGVAGGNPRSAADALRQRLVALA